MVVVVREVEYQHGPEEVFFSDWKKQQPFLVNWKLVYLGLFDEEMMQIRVEQSEHASLYQSRYELLFVFSLVMMRSQWDSLVVGVAVVGGASCGLAFQEGVGEEVRCPLVN